MFKRKFPRQLGCAGLRRIGVNSVTVTKLWRMSRPNAALRKWAEVSISAIDGQPDRAETRAGFVEGWVGVGA